jgi:NADH-ubiquinone oxidoreductase chain 2
MLIISLILILLSNAVNLRRDQSILYNRIAILALLSSFLLAFNSLYLRFLDKGIGLFGGLFHQTSITQISHLFLFIITIIILQLTAFYPRKVWIPELWFNNNPGTYYYTKIMDKMGQQFKINEYPLILLFIISGGVFLICASDLVSIFLSIELQSYGLYLLCTLYRNSELATSGGLTYFLLGGLSSCFILLGTSLLYANSGTSNLDGMYVLTSISDLSNELKEINNNIIDWYKSDYINISLLILSVGFLFKVSAAPFHFWSPDVYDSIPTIVTTFVAIIAKISIFVFLLELVHYTNNSLFKYEFTWTTSLLISSLLSLIVGSVLGLRQKRIKRLFAYSTISHVGFILLALSINSIESIQAFLFYLMQYSISNLNAFIILISVGFSLFYYLNKTDEYEKLREKANSPIQLINQLKGYFFINPVLALSLTITIFSFVGIPPLIGFFAKQMVLSAALDSGYVFLALIAILTSVISAVYYLNIIKEIFFDKPEYFVDEKLKNISLEGDDNFLTEIESNFDKPEYLVDELQKIAREGHDLDSISYNYNSTRDLIFKEKIRYNVEDIKLSSALTNTISILSITILLFIFIPKEALNLANLLALIIFNP